MNSETLEKANKIERQITSLNLIISKIEAEQRPLAKVNLYIEYPQSGVRNIATVPESIKERIYDEVLKEYVAERTLLQKELSEL
ncbi:MAG: hypothetical protein A2031_08250 [Deltaproteobacteria bacterium RBG_19FT_COMBO_43_11]|nr:MAG: hypothetical protein A2W27_08225 [Deltaproteobacteria bacterium RBG_16_44_11]OGP87186.1 MAG: hypothetical protein A2031_08250 [Deltaproteobacteria bacterium RBG_19FT_COMBO_43_11]